jgi:enoyl-CoA hydratase/carnithine racemase
VISSGLLSAVGDWVPAEAVVEDASVVVVEGDVADTPEVRGFLSRTVALTIGHGPRDIGCDLWSPDPADVDRWVAAAVRRPQTCATAAVLLRSPPAGIWDGLVAESAAYSVLQAGREFAGWLRSPDRPRPGVDRGRRVRCDELPGGGAEIVLTRPARHNALDVQMRDELLEAMDGLRHRDAPIVVRGEGGSFCSGGDLGQFGTFEDPAAAHLVRLRRSLAWRFAELGPRILAGLHGACLGAGIELPAFAARVVATEDAMIGLPEAGLGLIPGAGGTVSIPRRIGVARTLELIVTGTPVDAATAHAWGLVDEVVSADGLRGRLHRLASGP